MENKFIVIDGEQLVVGKVNYHRDLVAHNAIVKGGGLFHIERGNTDRCFLFGQSTVYGQCTKEDIEKALSTTLHDFKNMEIYFSTEEEFEDVSPNNFMLIYSPEIIRG